MQCVRRSTREDDAAGVLAERPERRLIIKAIDHGLLSGPVAIVVRLFDGLFMTSVETAGGRGRGKRVLAVPHVLHLQVSTPDQQNRGRGEDGFHQPDSIFTPYLRGSGGCRIGRTLRRSAMAAHTIAVAQPLDDEIPVGVPGRVAEQRGDHDHADQGREKTERGEPDDEERP